MKKILFLTTMIVIISSCTEAKPYIQASVNFGFFYSSLSPHGEWVECDWGYAWRPIRVVHGWRPYTHGRWVWTDLGWYWVSAEPFGWATYHYGRWQYDDYYGWIWIPDYEWGPAWVEWRYDNDYIGWAPLSPYATFSIGIGISFANNWITPIHYWNFVPCRYFTGTRIVDYVEPIDRARRIFGNTRHGASIQVKDNRIINRGVEVNFIERRTNKRINRVEIVEHERGKTERFIRDGGRDKIEIYRYKFDEKSTHNRNRDLNRQNIEPRNEQQSDKIYPNRRVESTPPSRRDIQRNERRPSTKRRNESMDRLEQQSDYKRGREQSIHENNGREMKRIEKQQPQIRERSTPQVKERQQPTERRDVSRSSRDRKRP